MSTVTFKQALWRRLLWWRFQLLQRHRHRRLALETVCGKPLLLLPGVMNPALFRSGPFLAEYLRSQPLAASARVLDLGCGSGVLALVAAERARQVTAVDIQPLAVRCCQINVLLNESEARVMVQRSDLFGALDGERFDLILFNPPFFKGSPDGPFDYAWRSEDVAVRFAAQLGDHLTAQGEALLILSSMGDEDSFIGPLADHGFERPIVAERELGNEILRVYRIYHDNFQS